MRALRTHDWLYVVGLLGALSLCSLAVSGPLAASEPIVGARLPSISPDGETICFSYLGDLWTVPSSGGRATRLTVHKAFDGTSRWSPDGKSIAFSSNREHNSDVYVIPSAGGVPRRLTFHSAPDSLCSWWPDGKRVVFVTYRECNSPVWAPTLYSVSVEGGVPTRVVDCAGYSGSISPDGKTMAIVRGPMAWWRRGYHGSANREIWLKPLDGSAATRFTRYDGNDSDPMWSPDGKQIYFLSDRGGVTNVWVKPVSGGEARKLTDFKVDGAVHASIAGDGSTIVCELDGRIYTVDTGTGQARLVPIFAPSDVKSNVIETETFTAKASEIALAPDGKQIAFVVRGEIFAMKKAGGKAKRLTFTPAREQNVQWSPDGKKLVFCSDRNGTKDIFVLESSTEDEAMLCRSMRTKTTQLAASAAEEQLPQWSPDGKKIAYLVDRGDLWVMDADGSNKRLLAEGPFIYSFDWSPDSKWITFCREGAAWTTNIYVVSLKDASQHNITKSARYNVDPHWSKDGKKIVFISTRAGNLQGWNCFDVWHVILSREDEEKYKERKREPEEKDNAARGQNEEDSKKEKKKKVKIRIDLEDIHRRAMRITRAEGSERNLAVSHDGKRYAFVSNALGKNDVFVIDEYGKKLRRITRSGRRVRQILWGPKDKKLYILHNDGSIVCASADGSGAKPVAYTAKMQIDHDAERLQMFNEAWRALNTFFYDPNFHGVDWASVREKYLPLVRACATQREFELVLLQMIGELKASHLGAWGPRDPKFEETGRLGLRFDPEWEGEGLRVKEVIKDGPCDKPDAKVRKGEIILQIDGKKVGNTTNYFGLLRGKVGEKVELLVAKRPIGKKRRVIVTPCSRSELCKKVYRIWVDSRKAIVDKLSNGRIGYIHIRGMDMRSFREFLRELVTEVADKEALIVDVRYNRGGWTHDKLLSILGRPVYFCFRERGGKIRVTQPRFHWTKPAVTLTNEYSFSDAEIFPYSFRKLGIGKLIGVPTAGGVISTGGIRLLNGTWFRVPSGGCYTLDGKNLENLGIKPDIYVENSPEEDFSTTSDTQLRKAVETLLKQIE